MVYAPNSFTSVVSTVSRCFFLKSKGIEKLIDTMNDKNEDNSKSNKKISLSKGICKRTNRSYDWDNAKRNKKEDKRCRSNQNGNKISWGSSSWKGCNDSNNNGWNTKYKSEDRATSYRSNPNDNNFGWGSSSTWVSNDSNNNGWKKHSESQEIICLKQRYSNLEKEFNAAKESFARAESVITNQKKEIQLMEYKVRESEEGNNFMKSYYEFNKKHLEKEFDTKTKTMEYNLKTKHKTLKNHEDKLRKAEKLRTELENQIKNKDEKLNNEKETGTELAKQLENTKVKLKNVERK